MPPFHVCQQSFVNRTNLWNNQPRVRTKAAPENDHKIKHTHCQLHIGRLGSGTTKQIHQCEVYFAKTVILRDLKRLWLSSQSTFGMAVHQAIKMPIE